MIEVINLKEQQFNKMSQDEKNMLAQQIGSLFDSFDEARQSQISIYHLLKPEIYLLNRGETKEGWKSKLHFNKLYSLFQTRQAFLWDNIYSHIDQMFDVEGQNEESSQNAPLQKASLVQAFEQMKITKQLDKAMEYLDTIGEMCFFVSWKRQTKEIRRPISFGEKVKNNPLYQLKKSTEHFGIFEKTIYDGAYVEAINPVNLVFDPAIDPDLPEEWDRGAKIIKTFETPDHICNNRFYSLSAEEKQLLNYMVKPNITGEDRGYDATDVLDDVIHDGKIEVLQYWGDYTSPDGHVLKNWCVVVIGRRIVARFGENPILINPIINVALHRDVDHKRGIPLLYSIYDLCLYQEEKGNLENDSQILSLNPPRFAPEGFFKKNKTVMEPGLVLEYKKGLEDPRQLIPVSLPLINNDRIIGFLDSTISGVSGIYPNMQGAEEDRQVTATEIRVKVSGQTTRLAKDLDTIKQNGIVVMVEKVADLIANMKLGDETIFVYEKGVRIPKKITDDIRTDTYLYRYTDSSGIQKKLNTNEQLMQVLTPVWNDETVPLNKAEIIKKGLENIGIENPDKYFVSNQTEINPNTDSNMLNALSQNQMQTENYLRSSHLQNNTAPMIPQSLDPALLSAFQKMGINLTEQINQQQINPEILNILHQLNTQVIGNSTSAE